MAVKKAENKKGEFKKEFAKEVGKGLGRGIGQGVANVGVAATATGFAKVVTALGLSGLLGW